MIGGGIVGLATALQLLRRRPDLRLAVVEKESALATHQTGHNSGVLHAGLYYAAGSLKARLCREGKAALERFADERGIPYRRCGKLVVALDEEEIPRLDAIRERARANGVEGLEEVGPERLREIEPAAAGRKALWSPSSGIIDFRRIALAFADEVVRGGGVLRTESRVVALETRGSERIVRTTTGDLTCRALISCAGLHADRVAALTGSRGDLRIVPFRGDYYRLRPAARGLVRGLIYPVPDPRFPFLGVHFTPALTGDVLAGPNAVLAFAREGYRRTDVSLRDLAGTLAFPGFRRLAARHWRTGLAELARDWSRTWFADGLRRYIPALADSDLVSGPSGVRAQAVRRDGTLVDDFAIVEGPRLLHIVNAPSPAATASLAIGRELAELAITRFELS
ncbi:MAG TPA: L-2-hydroxyglutarate oxidase [Thermoanaerobaculia bacterium]|nr:L-2-hydroxyglutarate oxidase [Thermoanaerobaculia bacterium]